MPDTQTPTAPAQQKRRGRSRRADGLLLLLIVVVAGGFGYGVYWNAYLRGYEATNDAYVGGDLVQVTSDVAGTVLSLHADDTQLVTRGQSLLELDPADASIAMAAAEADLAQAVRQVHALFAKADEERALIAARDADLRSATGDYKRRQILAGAGAVSAENVAHARDGLAQQTATLDEARRELDETMAELDDGTIATNPTVLSAAARLRDAALALQRTHIVAPVDGIVAKRSAQLGQRVAAGTPLMAIVPLDTAWVDANFKEVQVRGMRVGQPVTITADVYGSDVMFHGKLAGLSAGSGSAFSLLPAQNASGNWIKIVQRLPVRIALDPAELKAHPLRIGLSIMATVDVHDTSGPAVSTTVRATPLPDRPSAGDDPSLDGLIQKIIDDNSGSLSTAKKDSP